MTLGLRAPVSEQVSEPAIAMLKPDAWERGLTDAILQRLSAAGFQEEARREIRLTPDDVARLFLHPLPDYVAHLTSRPISAHLLRGPGGPERLYEVKWEIRNAFGAPDRLRNLIHGADEGNEHHLLLSAFFPEHPVERCCGAADLDLRFAPDTALDEADAVLRGLDEASSLLAVSLSLLPGQASLAALRRLPRQRLRVDLAAILPASDGWSFLAGAIPDEPVSALLAAAARASPADLARFAAAGHPVTLAELPVSADDLARYAADLRAGRDIDRAVAAYPLMRRVLELRDRGVTRMNVYRPGLSLMETELRGDLARLAGLRTSGGSAGRARPGTFSVSQACLSQPPLTRSRAEEDIAIIQH